MDTPRWHLRFANYRAALARLHEGLAQAGVAGATRLECDGVIQRFEFTWELAWKSMRDYLAGAGNPVAVATAINVIRAALGVGLIDDGDLWVAAMKDRNITSHDYDENAFERVYAAVKADYIVALDLLEKRLLDEQAHGN